MASAAAQLNVRIDPALKKSGDSVLARNKITPSEAVRALWDYLTRHQELPAFLVDGAAEDSVDAPSFDSGMGLALDIARTQCGFRANDSDPWGTMTESERSDWLADQLFEEMSSSCR